MNKNILGYSNKGNILVSFENVKSFCGFLHIEEDKAYNIIKNHTELDGIKYYPSDYYELEFNKLYENKISDATSDYVDQDKNTDFDWNKLNDPNYIAEKLNTSVYFEDRNKQLVKLTNKKQLNLFDENMKDKIKEDKLGGNDGGSYSSNGSSSHYKKAVLEYVDKQERCYGTFLAYALCFMQVDKYRDRAGKKDGVPVDKDMVKAEQLAPMLVIA